MTSDIDKTQLYILKGLLRVSDYLMKFADKVDPKTFVPELQPVVMAIKQHFMMYTKAPTVESLVEVTLPKLFKGKGGAERVQMSKDFIAEALALEIGKDDYPWLIDQTITFIKRNALEDAIMVAINEVKEGNMDKAVSLVQEANNLIVDDDLGLDYWEDLDERTERALLGKDVIPTGMEKLDRYLSGGWHKKTLNIFGAATNVGKTLILSDISLKLMLQGLNGLYITLEIYQDLLANRVDANLTETTLSEIPVDATKVMNVLKYLKKDAEKKGEPFGRFIIKEAPPNCLNSNGILGLVRELEMKRRFKPDFIVVDYIGLLGPNSTAFSDNTYGKLKTVAEELRAVACILDLPIFSAVQVNREAYGSRHPGLQNTSDSMGIPMSADVMIMVSRDEDEDGDQSDVTPTMRWFLAKSRVSKNNTAFDVEVEYEYQRIVCTDDDGVNTENSISVNAKKAKLQVEREARHKVTEHSTDVDESEEKYNEGRVENATKQKRLNI